MRYPSKSYVREIGSSDCSNWTCPRRSPRSDFPHPHALWEAFRRLRQTVVIQLPVAIQIFAGIKQIVAVHILAIVGLLAKGSI